MQSVTVKIAFEGVSITGIRIILCEIYNEEVMAEFQNARLLFAIGKSNVVETSALAIERSRAIISTLAEVKRL